MRILIATGGSPKSVAALRFGTLVARRIGAAATVVTVIKKESDRPRAETVLARAREHIPPDTEATLLIRVGHPAEEIVREAETGPYAAVVVGEKQHRGLVTRFLLGSTAERVVEHAPCPVIVAKGHVGALSRFLLCDSGAASPPLVRRFAAQLPTLVGPEDAVTVLHVMSQIAAGQGADLSPLEADAEDLIAQHQPEGELFQRDLDMLAGMHLRPQARVRHGIVVDEILAEAVEGEYDLVVIGAFRGEGWRRILLDDLAHEIIVRMDRPILVVR